LAKAERFLKTAKRALEQGGEDEEDSAAVLAIHAAISACDSLTVRHLGVRSTSQKHLDVLRLIDQLPLAQREPLKKQLRTLVSRKNVVEYEDQLLPRGDAHAFVKVAERVVQAARDAAKSKGR
jgi:HEPN domain-containing protein